MQGQLAFFQKLKLLNGRKYIPALFFLAGFVWDTLTIGRQVQSSDLIILSVYLGAAAAILWGLAHQSSQTSSDQLNTLLGDSSKTLLWLRLLPVSWREPAPYFLLQFLYGSLLSALFILYFKSASHGFALLWALLLACILISNEFLEHRYQRYVVAWTMFGFCAILLFNFALPSLLGSIHWAWFVVSTILGAGLTQLFYYKSRQSLASSFLHILPTWLLAGLLMVAYFSDMIPPVPLVKLEAAVGAELEKANGVYLVQVSAPAWWQVWRLFSDEVHIKQGEKLYYITAVFAPHGLQTRLYHRWEYRHGKNWVATPRIGFTLNGGRQAGFRGYTYKQNLQSGDWRVVVETEDAHTVSVDTFTLLIDNTNAPIQRKPRPI